MYKCTKDVGNLKNIKRLFETMPLDLLYSSEGGRGDASSKKQHLCQHCMHNSVNVKRVLRSLEWELNP